MDGERRQGTLDILLSEVGGLKSIAESTGKKIDELNTKVGIQNGRIGKLERWKAYLFGCTTVTIILIVPVALEIVKKWLTN